MADIGETVLEFVKDKSIRLTHKVSVIITAIICLWCLNDFAGFYRNYTINRRIEQIKELKEIDSAILKNPDVKKELAKVTYRITHEQSYLRNAWLWMNSYDNRRKEISEPHKPIEPNSISGDFWYKTTIMLVPYIIMSILILFLPYTIFFSKDSFKEKQNMILGVIVLLAGIYIYGLFYKALISFVPIFSNKLWVNYSINILGQVLIILVITGIVRHMKKRAL